MTPPNVPPTPDPSPTPRTRRRTLVLAAALLAAVAGIASLLLAASLGGPDDDGNLTPLDVDPAGPDARLRGTDRPARPVPPDAVDVIVVAAERGDPVEGVEVRRRGVLASLALADVAEHVELATTGADGRARLRGGFPAFVDVASAAWVATPAVVATEGGRTLRFEVVPRPVARGSLLEEPTATGLAGWTVGAAEPPHDAEPPRSDERGFVTWPGRRGLPGALAAGDGARRIHAFLLHAMPGRAEVRLAVPPVARTTRLHVADPEGRPVAGARAHVLSADSGVFVALDDGGEGDVEYGARDAVPLVVTAPGRVRRRVEADGRPELFVRLEPAAPRTFRLRRDDGAEVPDGTRLVGTTTGPASYGPQGPGLAFEGTVAAGLVRVDDLPSTPFTARVVVRGPGLLAAATVEAGGDPALPTDVRVAAPRAVTLRVAGADGAPAAALLTLHAPRFGPCADAGDALRAALDEAVRAGRSDAALASIVLRTGPEATIDVPAADVPVGIDVLAADGAAGCVTVPPGEGPVTLDLRLAPATAAPAATAVLVEWEDGAPAALVELTVVRDERGAVPTRTTTDSSGAALVAETSGRFVVHTTRPDGSPWTGDGPLLLPAPGIPRIRLRAAR
ncbi:MAG: hypothetical protein JNM10_14220 [Planctomycetia bacterium]|nr:hypothetical protein [Planctomycetia bacterium]